MAKEFQVLIICLILALSLGCSGNAGNLVQPLEGTSSAIADTDSNSQRQLWGMWDINFDTDKLEATAIPLRDLQAHFDVTQMIIPPACNDCLTININSFNPVTRILDADVTLRNPTPLNGKDVRGILYYIDKYGHILTNPDDYTTYWHIPDSNPYNPFKAFAKDQPNRTFAGLAQHTEKYLVYIPIPPAYFGITYAVDASWPGNCREPYSIDNFIQETDLYNYQGSKCMVSVDVYDWQNDVNAVQIFAPDIENSFYINMYHSTGNTWTAEVTNDMNDITVGDHNALIIATSQNSGEISLVDMVTIKVTEKPSGWAQTWGKYDPDAGSSVALDDSGNAYVSGKFVFTVDFDPGPGVDEHTALNGKYDAYLCKYNTDGVFQWAKTWGSDEEDEDCDSVAVDNSGYIYVVGTFGGTADLDPGAGTCEKTSVGFKDAYLSKFNSNGYLVWANAWGGDYSDYAYCIATDNSGCIYVGGEFPFTVDFDPDPTDVAEVTAQGYNDAYLSKFNSDGDFQWVRTWGYVQTSNLGVCLDKSNNIFTTGYFSYTVDFDPGPGIDEHTSPGERSAFLSKFDSNGDFQWARTWGGEECAGACIAADSTNSIYVGGWFTGQTDFDPVGGGNVYSNGEYDMFVTKHNSDGEFQYVLALGSDLYDLVNSLATDGFNNVYITGFFDGTIDFDLGPGVDERTPNKNVDAFLWKVDNSGYHLWVRTWGDTAIDVGLGVAADSPGNAFVSGEFMGICDFDPGPGVDQHSAQAQGDAFLVKYPPDGNW